MIQLYLIDFVILSNFVIQNLERILLAVVNTPFHVERAQNWFSRFGGFCGFIVTPITKTSNLLFSVVVGNLI